MSEVVCTDSIDFITGIFKKDKDPFSPNSWYALDGRFAFVDSRTRRYQIAWQASVGVWFLSAFSTPRAVFAKDQLLAAVKEYDSSRYENIVQNLYKGSLGVSSV